jgi:nucleotide-binding universal stress UspA family protein
MIQLKRVLAPVDFSDCSERAIEYAQELCEKYNAELHLLHVLEVQVTSTPQFTMGLAVPDLQEESSKLAQEELKAYPDKDWAAAHRVVRVTVPGSPFVEIVKYAREQQIDLMVLGTHGRTGLSHVFLGSVAENVIRQAPCPVLVVRKEGHQFVSVP